MSSRILYYLSTLLFSVTTALSAAAFPEATTGFQLPLTDVGGGFVFAEDSRDTKPQPYKCWVYHPGWDMNAASGNNDLGTPVLASAAGRVVVANKSEGQLWGRLVIQHLYKGQTFYTQYGHVSGSSIVVSVGDDVYKGQRIAKIGKEGADSAHLHFEVRTGSHPAPLEAPFWQSCNPSNSRYIVLQNLQNVRLWYSDPAIFVPSHGAYTPLPTRYSISAMDPLPPPSWVYPRGLNNFGQVIGQYAGNGFLWSPENGYRFLPLLTGDTDGGGSSINDSGQIAGVASNSFDFTHAVLWSLSGSSVQNLGFGYNSIARGINNSGLVAGSTCCPRAVLWSRSSGIAYLPPVSDSTQTFAVGVNNLGHAAGATFNGDAILWAGSSVIRLGINGNIGTVVTGLNDNDEVIGNSTLQTAYVWSVATGERTLGTLFPAGCSQTLALGINNRSEIVGRSQPCNITDALQVHSFIWQNGTIQDLNNLIPTNSGWQLIEASGINNIGQIVGYGLFNGQQRGFILSPIF